MEPIGPRTTSSGRNILPSNAISAAHIADGIQGKTPLINGMGRDTHGTQMK